MDPVQKRWMYENWLADQNDRAELAKNHAYLLASFWNPEAVKDILGAGVHTSSEEEFDETTRLVRESIEREEKNKQEKSNRKRKRRKLKE
jgi:hypothetical protein